MAPKDATKGAEADTDTPEPAQQQQAQAQAGAAAAAAGPHQQRRHTQAQQPVVATSTVINIAAHSLLMITVPFALFFASFLGGLDPLFKLAGGSIPSRETKSYVGAGLAVLGVNLVIASFVVAAFREAPEGSSKKDN